MVCYVVQEHPTFLLRLILCCMAYSLVRCRRRGLWVALAFVLALARFEFFRAPPQVVLKEEEAPREDRLRQVERQAHEANPNRPIQVVAWDGLKDMNQFIGRSFYGNPFCESMDALRMEDPNVFVVFHFTFGCQELFQMSTCGTGNFLALLYGMRLTADVYGDVEMHFTCHDAEETRNQLILPWLTGFFPARSTDVPSAFPDVSLPEACGGAYDQPLGHLVPIIQRDLRNMALALVGSKRKGVTFNTSNLPPLSFTPQLNAAKRSKTPPFAKVQLDEAVLHFRCGDLMDSTHWSFAFMNFRGYTQHFSPDVKSIGIITQPFAKKRTQRRWQDDGPLVRDRCRTVVLSLVEYIQQRFPRAKVRLHNEDSIALSYARMIFAKQVIVGISTFGIMPAVATFGTSYVRIPGHPNEVNQWILKPRIDTIVDNVIFIEDPKVAVEHIKALWEQEGENGVLAWFWNDTWTPDG
jgi:hypothetical protein